MPCAGLTPGDAMLLVLNAQHANVADPGAGDGSR
jgi:hypothetical protein